MHALRPSSTATVGESRRAACPVYSGAWTGTRISCTMAFMVYGICTPEDVQILESHGTTDLYLDHVQIRNSITKVAINEDPLVSRQKECLKGGRDAHSSKLFGRTS